MPLYEFRCAKCGHQFDLSRHMVERDDPAFCPRCKAKADRLMSAPTFRLKPGPSGGWASGGYAPPPPKPKEQK